MSLIGKTTIDAFYWIASFLGKNGKDTYPDMISRLFEKHHFNGDSLKDRPITHTLYFSSCETDGPCLAHADIDLTNILIKDPLSDPVMQFKDWAGRRSVIIQISGKETSLEKVVITQNNNYADLNRSTLEELPVPNKKTTYLVKNLAIIACIYHDIISLYIIDKEKSYCLQKTEILSVSEEEIKIGDLFKENACISKKIFEEILTGSHPFLQLGNQSGRVLFEPEDQALSEPAPHLSSVFTLLNALNDFGVSWGLPNFNHNYPYYIRKIFEENAQCNSNLSNHKWDFTNSREDFYKLITIQQMTNPIMEFKDKEGYKGILLHVKGKKNAIKIIDLKEEIPSSAEEEIILFQSASSEYDLNKLELICYIFQNTTRIRIFHQETAACLQDFVSKRTQEDELSNGYDDTLSLFKPNAHMPKSLLIKLLKASHPLLQLGNDPNYKFIN